ncbi:PucR family transcriptional regulator [Nocardia wallacei]|uniref:PucR family transcriptional regulator n=1 Tax=Nocardia wallacei TaxID=480035 RepID=UPI00245820AA|nr:helix-turn-helix domain-containing protein [Nocardia wallacei]
MSSPPRRHEIPSPTAHSSPHSEAVRLAHDFAALSLRGEPATGSLRRFDEAAHRWAHTGVSFDVVHHAVWEGTRDAVDRFVAETPGPPDTAAAAAQVRRTLETIHTMTVAAYHAFRREVQTRSAVTTAAEQALTVALLRGDEARAARQLGALSGADAYHVLAVRFSQPPDRPADAVWSRLSAELKQRCDTPVLSVSGRAGATFLVPEYAVPDDRMDDVLAAAAAAAGITVTATLVRADRDQVTDAHTRAHELLELACAAGHGPGLRRFRDLVVEYQVTRPGLARDRLLAILDPLTAQPELLDTLARHIHNELNRTRTAQELGVHANTVDHRLRRVRQLTGYDPNQLADLCTLRAALIIRAVRPARS